MITVRPRGKRWQYDIRFIWPEGGELRERANAPVTSKSGAERWAAAREAALLKAGKAAYRPPGAKPEPPPPPPVGAIKLLDFWPRVVLEHYEAERLKPSTISSAKDIFDKHLQELWHAPLDMIDDVQIAALKGRLTSVKPKTANNVLSVLSRVMTCAVRWKVLKARPCDIALLPVDSPPPPWFTLEEYRRLIDSARARSNRHLVLILLGGSAGLRRGEMRALKWRDVDMKQRHIRVERATWMQQEGTTKGGKFRIVPMTDELHEALEALPRQGERVLYSLKGAELSNRTARNWLGQALRGAGLEVAQSEDKPSPDQYKDGRYAGRYVGRYKNDIGALHKLRHTFCSHLALAGVPAKVIQELAGHADLKTTLRYMHLAPADKESAMKTLSKYYGKK